MLKFIFLIKKIHILYIYVGPKNLKVFSHIEVVKFVWSGKFEVYMLFHLRETKKEKSSCCKLIGEYGSQSNVGGLKIRGSM